jgi:hypothetical protein
MRLTTLRSGVLLTLFTAIAQASTIAYIRDAAPAENHYHNDLYRSQAGYTGSASVRAGLLHLEASMSGADGFYFNLFTYCADPFLPLSVGPVGGNGAAFELVSLSGFGYSANTIDLISKLYGNVYYDSHTSATKAAAFQFLVWEYIADPTFNLNSGFTRITNSEVRAQALAWHGMQSQWTQHAALSVLDGRAEGRQSFFLKENMMPLNEAENPEPASMALIGAGLLAVYWRRRRA